MEFLFFTIMIPFLSILFVTFFATSYYLKLSNENFEVDLKEFKEIYILKSNNKKELDLLVSKKIEQQNQREQKFKDFMVTLTGAILVFMALFSLLMISIITDVVKKYKRQVQNKEAKLQSLNKTLSTKVEQGIEEGKAKDKAMFQQSRLARLGTMLSMIAHQWRQPLTELSGILMELETATRFKKVNDEHILNSIDKSDKLIEFYV